MTSQTKLGFHLYKSQNNIIVQNNVAANTGKGISVRGYSYDNLIYHNNFVGNSPNVEVSVSPDSTCFWDDGYPSGGNFWSDYTGVDIYSSSNQDVPGGDGIGDIPYVIDEENADAYPLMDPYSWVTWDYVFEDAARGPVFKMDTINRFFQFIAPDKEFSVKYDASMKIANGKMRIKYEDWQLKIRATASDTERDFCRANARDVQTSKKYLLRDKSGIET